MSYQVLARKWRPRNFSTLVGQEHVVRALTHALTNKRLHHAYLFTGTRGVGKTTLARILAKALNCEAGITATPCGQCSACQEIDSGRFVDLLEVDAATNTRVDEMRQLLENAVYAPTRGRFKVYVIDEVHMLSNSAFNAMLKTLEEPPEHVKFILATTDPQKIPVTVLSRCLQFNLKQMPIASISEHLANILRAEEIPFEAAALSLVARSAFGSMRDALSLLDQAIAHGAGAVEETLVKVMLGTVDRDYLFGILSAISEGDVSALLQIAGQLSVRSLSYSAALQELALLLTRIQIAQFSPNSLDRNAEDGNLMRMVELFSPAYVQLAYQIVNFGRQELASAPDEYAGFVMTLLRLHAFRPSQVSDVVNIASKRPVDVGVSIKSQASESKLLAAKLNPVSDEVAPIATKHSNHDSDGWKTILAALPLSGLARELAQNCELRKLEDGLCLLRLSPTLTHLQMKPSPDKLQQALSEYFARPIQLRIELAQNETVTPAESAGRLRQELQQKAIAAISGDEFVRDVVDSLEGSLIETSIKPIV